MDWLSAPRRLAAQVPDAVQRAGAATSDWLGDAPRTADAATAGGDAPLFAGTPDTGWGQIGQSVGDVWRGAQQEAQPGVTYTPEDLPGVLDRQRAQRDLSDRFQVMPAGVGGEQSNQVSQEEYQGVARQLSDIRLGNGDLTIDTSRFLPGTETARDEWSGGIQADVGDLLMTESGRRQVGALADNPNDVQTGIGPYAPKGSLAYDGARAIAADSSLGPTDAMRDAQGTPAAGIDATVEINPGMILGLRSDAVLAHELEHALGYTTGTLANGVSDSPNDVATRNGVPLDIRNWERQAVGLTRSDVEGGGAHLDDPHGMTENEYRRERNDLGDRFLPRTKYTELPGEAPASMSDADLETAWTSHLEGPNVPKSLAPTTSPRPRARPTPEPTVRPRPRPER